jgi:hypothetical protein
MRIIKLTQGKEALVDDEYFEELNRYKWCCDSNGYAVRVITIQPQNKKLGIKRKQKTIKMHRIINNTTEGFDTDHINGNKLDNRKSNLRVATKQQNIRNRKTNSSNNTSGFKGVFWNKVNNKCKAQIRHNNQSIYLGYFDTAKEAAIAYNTKASELFQEFARLNIIL